MIERDNRTDEEREYERAEALRQTTAQWLSECTAAEYFVNLSPLRDHHTPQALQHMLNRWAGRQAKLLKTQLTYRGMITDAGVNHRQHIHLLVWGRNRQGLTLSENHRCPQWFDEYALRTQETGMWAMHEGMWASVHAEPVGDKAALIRYIAYANFSTNLFHPVQGWTNKILQEVHSER